MDQIGNYREVYSGEVVDAFSTPSTGLALVHSHQGRVMARNTQLEKTKVYCRCAVGDTALNYLGVLSATEAALSQKMPWAENRFRAVVDCCTAGILRQIDEFQP